MNKFILILALCGIGMSMIYGPPPPKAVDPFFNGIFPEKTPGAQGAWELYDFAPDNKIPAPLKMIDVPGENSVLIITKRGEVWKMDLESKAQQLVLDIKDRTLKLGDAGVYGIAIHPDYLDDPSKRFIYLFYRAHSIPDEWDREGYNRLTKFYWPSTEDIINKDTEEILFQQYDRNNWHSGGGLFFGNDGFLYLSVGDEGIPDEEDLLASVQRLDGGLFSGMLRIDVDMDSTRSHPIRRQPIALEDPPEGWWETFSQGYYIPNDNPWLDENGEILEEYFALGLRSPYTAYYDTREDEIWVGDVGAVLAEEINLVEKGGNYQWPYKEGEFDRNEYSKPDPLIGIEKPPFLSYTRDVGSTIILSGNYYGSLFPSLNQKMLMLDFVRAKVMTVDNDDIEPNVLIEGMGQFNLDLPSEPLLVGMNSVGGSDGLILFCVIDKEDYQAGKILALRNKEVIPDPPNRLSELGVFKDLPSRELTEAFIPYTINSPLWSDRAVKTRYMAIPNDGKFDSPEEKILFRPEESWSFPVGSVIVKHFELPLSTSDPEILKPLETRFIIIGQDSVPYGLTYKWNEDGTEAFLQTAKSSEKFEITRDGDFEFEQEWDYPSRTDCRTCHNKQAGYVLGLKTHQLNVEIDHPESGDRINQLSYLNSINVFRDNISNPLTYLRSYPLEDSSIDLETRILSYFDANCASCHRKGGLATESDLDLRYEIALSEKNIINYRTKSHASVNTYNVLPGNPEESEMWVRDYSLDQNRMPPLASNLVDQMYIDSLTKWIGTFEPDTLSKSEVQLFPNPIQEILIVKIGASFLPNCEVTVYDILGRVVHSSEESGERFFIDLSGLIDGHYIVKIKRDNFEHYQKVLVN